jgi:hypothetical protein
MQPPVNYAVDYSVLQVKNMIKRSEARKHPLKPSDFGHADSRHQAMSDAGLVARSQTMKGKNQDASAFSNQMPVTIPGFGAFDQAGNLVSTDYWKNLRVNDQAFLVACVLNSQFGQSALELLNFTLSPRLTISALPMPGFRMRVSTSGGNATSSSLIGRLVIVIEPAGMLNGYPELHFVTAYPLRNRLDSTFGMMPGTTRTASFGGNFATKPKSFKWDSTDQNDANTKLVLLP